MRQSTPYQAQSCVATNSPCQASKVGKVTSLSTQRIYKREAISQNAARLKERKGLHSCTCLQGQLS
eukprot:67699-Pelagomonas_calceolata.AAC.1